MFIYSTSHSIIHSFLSIQTFHVPRLKSTPDSSTLSANIIKFEKDHSHFLSQLPKKKQEETNDAISKMKEHIALDCVSNIPPGYGTASNEGLHRLMNRSFMRGKICVGYELSIAMITLLCFAYNKRKESSNKNEPSSFVVIETFSSGPLPKMQLADMISQESIDIATKSTVDDLNTQMIQLATNFSIHSYNCISKMKAACNRKGFNCFAGKLVLKTF